MTIGLPGKLFIFVIWLFALAFAAMFLYRPLRYAWLEWRLQSENAATRKAAAADMASDGLHAVERLREMLKSNRDERAAAACLVIEYLPENMRQRLDSELKDVLNGTPSDATDAAVLIVLKRENLETDLVRLQYSSEYKGRQGRNVLCCILRKGEPVARQEAAARLGWMKDREAADRLYEAMTKDGDAGVRLEAAIALARCGDGRAIAPLTDALSGKSDGRVGAAFGLAELGDKRAIPPLLEVFAKDKNDSVRMWAAHSLGKIGLPETIEPLIATLKNDNNSDIRAAAAQGLELAGEVCVIVPLIEAYANDDAVAVHSFAGMALNAIMPQGFPKCSIGYGREQRGREAAAMKEWMEKNGKAVWWSGKDKKFFLEGGK